MAHRTLVWLTAAAAINGTFTETCPAQPEVPVGFTAQLIAPPLDGQIPQLSAIDDAAFGTGVVTATATSGIVNMRLVDPAGVLQSLAVWNEAPASALVIRVRLDSGGVIDNLIHVTVRDDPESTHFISVTPDGEVVERWVQGGTIGFDFDFSVGEAGNPIGAVLLDRDVTNGTVLAAMDTAFQVDVVNFASSPPGRTDTDVQGFQRDTTGNYGGGILLADTDRNNDDITAIYEVRDVLSGGSYRLVGAEVPTSVRAYGDLAIVAAGDFGGVIYVTETLTDEIQQVDPLGAHTTWASGFSGIDSLSITSSGDSMYVGDLDGIWLIRATGAEPGPVVLCHEPNDNGGSSLSGEPTAFMRIIFDEPVAFTGTDVTITNDNAEPVTFEASGSGSQFMLLALGEPLFADTYTVTVADTVTAVATGLALDGDHDGSAGGDAVISITHRHPSDSNGDGCVSFIDLLNVLSTWSPCP